MTPRARTHRLPIDVGPWQAELIAPAAWPGSSARAVRMKLIWSASSYRCTRTWLPAAKLQQLLAVDYPQRFGEIRPTPVRSTVSGLNNCPPASVPRGLRNRLARDRCGRPACHRLSPAEYRQRPALRDCLSSIADIEALTGLNLLPEMDTGRAQACNWATPAGRPPMKHPEGDHS